MRKKEELLTVTVAAVLAVVFGLLFYFGTDKKKELPVMAKAFPAVDSYEETVAARGRKVRELGETLEEKIKGYRGTWSVYLEDKKSGETVTVNDARMNSASVVKLYVMAKVLSEIENGTHEDSPAVRNALEEMITYSDNDAWRYLTNYLGGSFAGGMEKVTEFCAENGYPDSGRLAYSSCTSAKDTGRFLSRILDGTNVSEEASDEMLGLLTQQYWREKIPAGVPQGVVTANKTGELDEVQNDAAIVFAPGGTYILVVLTDGGLIEDIRDFSAYIYEGLN